jgi:two-component system cell cycle sensor histidine kinase/response regulator CckA
MIVKKPTYEKLEQRVKELEKEAIKRTEAEEALRESEEKYRTILESIEEGYYEVDIAGNFTFFNDSMSRMIGYSKDEMMGMNNRQFMDEVHAKEVFEAFNKVYRTGIPTKAFDWKLMKKDGSDCFVETSVSLIRDSGGEPVGFRGIARDVTQRKEMDEALKNSEERYRTILENIVEGYYEVDLAGNLTFFNDSLCSMTGISRDELMGMNNLEYMDEDTAKRVYQVFNGVYETGKPVERFEYEIVLLKDGAKRNVETSVALMKDSQGHPVGFRGLLRDITERTQAEKALRESKDNLDKAQKIAHIGNWSRDLNLDRGQWSDETYRILGLTPGDPEGPSFETFLTKVHPADRERVTSVLKGAVEKKRPFDFEFRTVPIEGSERIIRNRGEVEYDETGTPLRIFGIDQDITERRHLQAQLLEAKKMEAISTLAGGIAHQFNNALTTITGYVGLLEMDHRQDEKIEEYTAAMKQSAHRMAHLTSQLLAYARGGKYNPQVTSLSDFVEDALPLIRHTVNPQVRFESDLPTNVLSVNVDTTQMQMILFAIVANSNEAIQGSGRIRISTRNLDLDRKFIKDHPGLKPGPYVCLSIEDDGKGMDKETKNRIFEPFFTTHFIGRGLGMAAVYGIVQNHEGWVSVDSEPGKGTVVKIYLPAIPNAQTSRAGLPAI